MAQPGEEAVAGAASGLIGLGRLVEKLVSARCLKNLIEARSAFLVRRVADYR